MKNNGKQSKLLLLLLYWREKNEKNCGKNVMSLNEWNNIILTMRQTKTLIIGIKLNFFLKKMKQKNERKEYSIHNGWGFEKKIQNELDIRRVWVKLFRSRDERQSWFPSSLVNTRK